MCLLNQLVQIHSFKHNGALHRYWEQNYVIDETDEYYIVANNRTRVVEADGRRWFTHEPAVTFFAKNAWFNVICMMKDDGICYYCNIASPAIFDDGKIKYIDYDLDLKLFPDKNIKILDEREYEKHRIKFNYGDRLDRVLKSTTKHIEMMMKNNEYPFRNEVVLRYYQLLQLIIK